MTRMPANLKYTWAHIRRLIEADLESQGYKLIGNINVVHQKALHQLDNDTFEVTAVVEPRNRGNG